MNTIDKSKARLLEMMGRVNPSFINENGFARLNNIMHGQVDSVISIGIITAENPMQNPLSSEENKNRNDMLRSDLRRGNLGFVQIKGKYGVIENPFFVMNITKTMCIELGNKYNQESVIWGSKQDNDGGLALKFEYIEGETTTQERSVVIGSGDELENADNYYSEVKGRRFLIPFFDDNYVHKQNVRGKVLDKDQNPISETVYIDIVTRVSKLRENYLGMSAWGNRGMVLEILKKNNAYFFD